MSDHLTLIPYADTAVYMVFREGTHLVNIPYLLIDHACAAPARVYTREEADMGVSYPGAEPGREHCIPPGHATHDMTHEEHKRSYEGRS